MKVKQYITKWNHNRCRYCGRTMKGVTMCECDRPLLNIWQTKHYARKLKKRPRENYL